MAKKQVWVLHLKVFGRCIVVRKFHFLAEDNEGDGEGQDTDNYTTDRNHFESYKRASQRNWKANKARVKPYHKERPRQNESSRAESTNSKGAKTSSPMQNISSRMEHTHQNNARCFEEKKAQVPPSVSQESRKESKWGQFLTSFIDEDINDSDDGCFLDL